MATSALPSPQQITVSLPTGPLGVSIQSQRNVCIVTSIEKSTTPLKVGDAIISLNGTKLAGMAGGVTAWAQLFRTYADGKRTLVLERQHDSRKFKSSRLTEKYSAASENGRTVDGAATEPPVPEVSRKMGTDEMKEHALKDSTLHQNHVTKKQKVDEKRKSTNNSKSASNVEIISLLDDSDDEEHTPPKNAESVTTAATTSSASDPEIMEVFAPSTNTLAASSAPEPQGNLKDDRDYNTSGTANNNNDNDEEEEELTVIGTKGGYNALVDFPHARQNCVSHPFANGNRQLHCDNCYCYVCDCPAADCKSWSSHCEACHDSPHWRSEREKAKRQAREQTALASSATSTATVSTAASSVASLLSSFRSSSTARSKFEVVSTLFAIYSQRLQQCIL